MISVIWEIQGIEVYVIYQIIFEIELLFTNMSLNLLKMVRKIIADGHCITPGPWCHLRHKTENYICKRVNHFLFHCFLF